VIEHLINFKAKYLRIDLDRPFEYDISNAEMIAYINGSKPFVLWIRTNFTPAIFNDKRQKDFIINVQMEHVYSIISLLLKYSKYTLGKGFFTEYSIAKLDVLENAQKIGFNVPYYELICTKYDLHRFIKNNYKAIAKPFGDITNYNYKNHSYNFYYKELNIKKIKNIPDEFGITLFQKRIDSILDIKTVFIDGYIHAISIYRIGNKKCIDFAEISTNDLRYSKFKIDFYKDKITSLVNHYDLNFCVMDFIIDADNKLYFLELNPYGHFQALSAHTNSRLEYEIAKIIHEKLNKLCND